MATSTTEYTHSARLAVECVEHVVDRQRTVSRVLPQHLLAQLQLADVLKDTVTTVSTHSVLPATESVILVIL